MTTRMLIDATHEEETRVVVMDGNRVVDYDSEIASKRPLKGNIYLAKVTRVEPSLQAAFVEYGGNRHGFLAFNEIHPDYYRIPVADREKLIEEVEASAAATEDGEASESVDVVGGDDIEHIDREHGGSMQRRYKIQEVIKRRQILLVQVVKEERGTKGAALTTFLSLPGRYCVLMPNTPRGGGISRKITNAKDRKRLKGVIDELGITEGMAVILRTAGSERSKAEIKRDYEYLLRLWNEIRELTLASTAPALIYEEGNLIKRTIRDLYSKDIEEILVDGEEAYKTAKEFMRTLIPSHAKKVQKYAETGVPLFQRFQAEAPLEAIHSPTVQLRSGGYIVIHQTEALVAIDVNSGRATRERHIEETALKTNSEAAEEIARQLRLRDLAGLIVIDFIDMEEHRNNHSVERKFKDALRNDRARIQLGRISPFGLLEMSRQRLRPSLMETTGDPCPHCNGTGYKQSTDWMTLQVLRAIAEEGQRGRAQEIEVTISAEVALYLLNQKRQALSEIEQRHNMRAVIRTSAEIQGGSWSIAVTKAAEGRRPVASGEEERVERPRDEERGEEEGGRRRRRGRRRPRRHEEESATPEIVAAEDAEEEMAEAATDLDAADAGEVQHAEDRHAEDRRPEEERGRKRRRRGRRGGRRRNRQNDESTEAMAADGAEGDRVSAESSYDHDAVDDARPVDLAAEDAGAVEPESAAADITGEAGDEQETRRPPRARRPRRRRAASTDAAVAEVASEDEVSGEEAPVTIADTDTAEVAAAVEAPVDERFPDDGRDAQEPAAEPEAVEAEAAATESGPSPEEPEPAEEPEDNGEEDRVHVRVQTEEDTAEPVTPPDEPESPPAEPEPQEPPRRGWWQRVVS